MAETVEAGWYDDPWSQAPLRWWDGQQWTAHISQPLPPPPPSGALSRLVGTSGRVAVVDVETTGLYNTDRVLEVAVVTLDQNGFVVDRFETLVNPDRDVGPVWLHGISAQMLGDAPLFEDVVDEVAARLDGAVLCAHNLPFDTRMLGNEFERCGIDVHWGAGLDTLRVTGTKLGVACAEAGIEHSDAHSALGDAEATGRLLVRHAHLLTATPEPAVARPFTLRRPALRSRSGIVSVQDKTPFLAELMALSRAEPDVAPYVHLLDVALADLALTADERLELRDLAEELGLDRSQVARAHRDLLGQMIDAAVADHVVTAEEYELLARAAALLEVDIELVDRRTEGLRSEVTQVDLAPGMTVCFTGSATDSRGREIPRTDLQAWAADSGLEPVKSVTARGCQLLVAADPGSRSGKAAKARRFGIPIASVLDFTAALHGDQLRVSVLSSAGVALVCIECGTSWLASRRSQSPRCGACRIVAEPSDTPTEPDSGSPNDASPAPHPTGLARGSAGSEQLVCERCGVSWIRERVRGREPKTCPDCRTL